MKKGLIKLLAALVLASAVGAAVYSEEAEVVKAENAVIESEAAAGSEYNIPETVEIVFMVGDNTLIINGESVVTETAPYVVETETGGVTLVPVRVITEAFGAVVGWDEAARTVTVSYPDVEILLQIGSTVAEVNGEAVTLLSAPELNGGRTMVPLRFISETLGAVVEFDDETKLVSVIKDDGIGGDTIVGGIETEFIGDSKYNWMMLNPKDFVISARYDDGTYTEFEDEYYNSISIDIEDLDDDFDFDAYFKEVKAYEAEYATLNKADKDADNKTMHFQSRTSYYFYDTRVFVTDEYICTVSFGIPADDADAKKLFLEIADSFKIGFEGDDIHDLYEGSEDDESVFESEELGFKIVFPENFSNKDYGYGINDFVFYGSEDDSITKLSVEIVSKEEAVLNPEEYLEKFKSKMQEGIDTKLVALGDVSSQKLFGTDVFVYDYVIEGTKYGYLDKTVKLISFDLGEYTYRLRIDIDADDENAEASMTALTDNMEFSVIDHEEFGIILDSIEKEEEKEAYRTRIGKHTIDLPAFLEESGAGLAFSYSADFSKVDFEISCGILPIGYSLENMITREILYNELYLQNEETTYEISGIEEIVLGETAFLTASFDVHETNSIYRSFDIYVCEKDGYIFTATSYTDELYEEYGKKTVEEILSTLKMAEKTVQE